MTIIHKLVQFYAELHHLAFWIKMKRLVYSVFVFVFLLGRITHLSLRAWLQHSLIRSLVLQRDLGEN